MKLLLENWRKLLNEISFEDAKKRLETKALTKWIKGMAFDEETKTMTLDPSQIEAAKNELAKLVLEFVPEDLTDGKPDANGNPTKPQKGMTLEWLISVGINDPYMKQNFYNEAMASTETDSDRVTFFARADLRVIRGDFERYWHSHEYSDQKDIFSIKSFADLAVAADRAKRKYDDAMQDKEFQDPEKGTEVFDHPDKNKWFIAALHTKAAACHYGKRTDWCTATDTDMFDQYYEPDDPLFYFEDRQVFDRTSLSKPAADKYRRQDGRFQFHFGSDSFMDNNDSEVDEETRDYFIDLLSRVGAAKTLPEFVPGPLAAPAKKYQIVQYWVERTEMMQIVNDENTTEQWLMDMAEKTVGEGEREMLEAIAESPNVTVEILKFIAAHDENGIDIVIYNEKFPIEAIEELANSEDKEIRYSAAVSGKLSAETLTRLSEDEYWHVRGAVAKDEKTPPEALAKLATDEKYEGVVDALLGNKSLPSELFEPILKRAQEEDAKGAVAPYKTRPADGGEWSAPPAHLYRNAEVAAAGNPKAPEELLRALVADSLNDPESRGWYLRVEVARNPSTPIDLLQALAKDEHAHVRNPAKRELQTREWRQPEEMKSIRENFKRFLK
jgi:hypothetical protein